MRWTYLKDATSKSSEFAVLMIREMFDEMMFAILPLLVLVVITVFLGDFSSQILLMKEWSFATIVLFGVGTRRLIRFKVNFQLAHRSWTLDRGVQYYIFLTIMSVLILSLVILTEKGALAIARTEIVAGAQLMLFAISVLAILSAGRIEQQYSSWASNRELMKRQAWFVRRMNMELERAEEHLVECVTGIEGFRAELISGGVRPDVTHEYMERRAILVSTVTRLRDLTKNIEDKLADL